MEQTVTPFTDAHPSARICELAAPSDAASRRSRSSAAAEPLLDVRDLRIELDVHGRRIRAVDGVSFELLEARTLAIVGESGAGKSLSCAALMGFFPERSVVSGSIRLQGKELVGLTEAELRRFRGLDISMVRQDTDGSLNPIMQVGRQITEAMFAHQRLDQREARERAIALLNILDLPDAERMLSAYSHQLSGGMRQRVMIAIALACGPKVLVIDEATRSLDVTSQAEVLTALSQLQARNQMSIVMVSHDLRVAARFAHEILVMRDGHVVEQAPSNVLFAAPRAPYAKALVGALLPLEGAMRPASGASDPAGARNSGAARIRSNDHVPGVRPVVLTSQPVKLGAARSPSEHSREHTTISGATSPRSRAGSVLLDVRHLTHEFTLRGSGRVGRRALRAVSNVSFEIRRAETLGLAGESGSGKSTLARAIVQMPRPSSGNVLFDGVELTELRGREAREARRRIQMVFQEPLASLDPKWRVADIVEEPLVAYGVGRSERRRRVNDLLERVGLPADTYGARRPRQLSGGQCQRVAIARALALEPDFLICDEVVSSLDVLVQAQILDLLARLRTELGLSCLFVSHDLAVLRQLSDRIAVLYSGELCEIGATDSLYGAPAHPFTRALLASAMFHERDGPTHAGDGRPSKIGRSSPLDPQRGCRFRGRCPSAGLQCASEQPSLRQVGADHWVACHFPVATEAASTPAAHVCTEPRM
jgi:peptide/nickel transport system ATP-binding protein